MLRLEEIRLRNIRSYESAALDLAAGVTVLTGDVGSGKTSVLHAIEMALFGFAEVEAPYLVRHRCGEAAVALTLRDESHTYELARTFRRRTRRGREVFDAEEPTFRVDGELRRYSVTEFRQRVIELLGFPDNPNPRSRSDLWRWAVYTPQERMREILHSDEADARLETIRKALGLERYRRAADNAEGVAATLRAEARSHTDVASGLQHFESDFARADGQLGEANTAAQNAEAAAADARRAAAEVEELVQASETDRRRREADQRQRDHLQAEEVRLSTASEASQRRLDHARAQADARESEAEAAAVPAGLVAERRSALESTERALKESRAGVVAGEAIARELVVAEGLVATLSATRSEADRTEATGRSELDRAERDLREAGAREPTTEPLAPTPRTVEAVLKELVELRTSERSATETWSARKAESGEIASLLSAGVCPRCHQTVAADEFRTHQHEAERAASEASATLESIRGRLAELENERAAREQFDRLYQAWRAREASRQVASETLARLRSREAERAVARTAWESRWGEATEHAAKVRAQAQPFADAAVSALRAEDARDRAREALHDAERKAAEAEARRTSAQAARALALTEEDRWREGEERRADVHTARETLDRSLLDSASSDLAHAQLLQRRETLRTNELRTQRELTAAAERVSFATERRTEAEAGVAERRERLAEARRFTAAAEFLAGPFRDTVLDLERRLLGRAQSTFERSFARAFSALVEDPGLVARCGPTFIPYVEIEGEWTPAEALSGGERTALALAFRLALGEVVRAASRLRLDTIILDEPTDGFSPEQVERMGELLRTLPWGQVIVVTHEAGLAAIADRSVHVEKVAGVSRLAGDGVPGETAVDAPAPAPRRRRTKIDIEVPLAK